MYQHLFNKQTSRFGVDRVKKVKEDHGRDLDLGLGFGTGLGLDDKANKKNILDLG